MLCLFNQYLGILPMNGSTGPCFLFGRSTFEHKRKRKIPVQRLIRSRSNACAVCFLNLELRAEGRQVKNNNIGAGCKSFWCVFCLRFPPFYLIAVSPLLSPLKQSLFAWLSSVVCGSREWGRSGNQGMELKSLILKVRDFVVCVFVLWYHSHVAAALHGLRESRTL